MRGRETRPGNGVPPRRDGSANPFAAGRGALWPSTGLSWRQSPWRGRRRGSVRRTPHRPSDPAEPIRPAIWDRRPSRSMGCQWEGTRRAEFPSHSPNGRRLADARAVGVVILVRSAGNFVRSAGLSCRTSPSTSGRHVKTFLPIPAPPPWCCQGCCAVRSCLVVIRSTTMSWMRRGKYSWEENDEGLPCSVRRCCTATPCPMNRTALYPDVLHAGGITAANPPVMIFSSAADLSRLPRNHPSPGVSRSRGG